MRMKKTCFTSCIYYSRPCKGIRKRTLHTTIRGLSMPWKLPMRFLTMMNIMTHMNLSIGFLIRCTKTSLKQHKIVTIMLVVVLLISNKHRLHSCRSSSWGSCSTWSHASAVRLPRGAKKLSSISAWISKPIHRLYSACGAFLSRSCSTRITNSCVRLVWHVKSPQKRSWSATIPRCFSCT